MLGLLPLKNGNRLAAVQKFLKSLLVNDVVDAIYVPLESGDGPVLPALVTDPTCLEQANPLAPVMPINGARAVAALTQKKAPARLGAVLRACELRALLELVKLQQACLEDVLLISLDCLGTYEVSDYLGLQKANRFSLPEFIRVAGSGEQPDPPDLRQACGMCTLPIPERADLHLWLYGCAAEESFYVQARDDLAEKIGLTPAADQRTEPRRQALQQLAMRRQERRLAEIAAIQARLSGDGTLAGQFAACLRCHNCMTACPICYCKTCLFRSAAFDHPPEHYVSLARRKGAVRLLGDTLLFHLTRLNHMAASCVSCGMCTSACPVDIPVGLIFSAIGSHVQAAFEYSPGRDLNEPLPLVTFQPNEWNEIGEAR